MAAKKKPKRDACYKKVKARYRWWDLAISLWVWGIGKVQKSWRKELGQQEWQKKEKVAATA